MKKNLLIKGDNIVAMEWLLDNRDMRGKVDLVYIDPPFATNTNFTITDGRASTVSNSRNGDTAYSDKLLGDAFIEFLRARLVLLRELMSSRGSIYLHIDYKIGHYVKVMMDEVFGIENFRNDITRIKCNPKNFPRLGYGNIKDLVLFYTKGRKPIWHEPLEPYSEKDIEVLFPKIDAKGRRYTTVPIHAPGETQDGKSAGEFKGMKPPVGRHWRTDIATMEKWDANGEIEWSSTGNPRKIIFAHEREGKRRQDIWEFKDPMYPCYPTEKNPDMLDLIVKTSSDKDSIVMDCFCGSGSTLKAAARNGRHWIGIDASDLAIEITRKNLDNIERSLLNQDNGDYEFIELPSATGKLVVEVKQTLPTKKPKRKKRR